MLLGIILKSSATERKYTCILKKLATVKKLIVPKLTEQCLPYHTTKQQVMT